MKLLIVEDDRAVRAELMGLCERGQDLRVIGEASSGKEAIQAVEALRPNLLLVDAELPDMTGFDVLRALQGRYQRRTVVLTARAEDAAATFAAGALDYLLKPICTEAFSTAILRARGRFKFREETSPGAPRPSRPVQFYLETEHSRPLILVGEREHRLYPLDAQKIDYIESAGNYVRYRIANTEYIARESIKRLHGMLCSTGFIRIERSLLLNIRAIAYSQPSGRSTFAFTLVSGAQLHSGPSYRKAILDALPLKQREAPRGGKRPHPLYDGAARAGRALLDGSGKMPTS